ncbi:Spy/CpxP family protein refolding chaperone [Fulvivirga maritima]|uniref:Spy/CpxP family protein refolding chaperone n=1 Tax=Fulvivirga maritima TaxID=2904247 RepID=UPI001F2F0EAB|nr:Spy/CpxP family protein refolding chaperone [Fulvivirga maritima]UII28046.1 Spy/CpxP family protein refolding chaperone [Fulvivirga maritima]
MKKILMLVWLTSISWVGFSQDVFQQELYSADLVMKYRNEIKLTDKQVTAIKKIHADHMANFNSLKWDMDAYQVSMKQMLEGSHVDSEKSIDMLEKMLVLEKDAKKIRLSMLIEIKNQLTAAQQKELNKYKEADGQLSYNFITPINENPRVVLKIDQVQADSGPKYYIKTASGLKEVDSVKDLNPADIKSLNVYKGETAVEKFGETAANGVIVVELK